MSDISTNICNHYIMLLYTFQHLVHVGRTGQFSNVIQYIDGQFNIV